MKTLLVVILTPSPPLIPYPTSPLLTYPHPSSPFILLPPPSTQLQSQLISIHPIMLPMEQFPQHAFPMDLIPRRVFLARLPHFLPLILLRLLLLLLLLHVCETGEVAFALESCFGVGVCWLFGGVDGAVWGYLGCGVEEGRVSFAIGLEVGDGDDDNGMGWDGGGEDCFVLIVDCAAPKSFVAVLAMVSAPVGTRTGKFWFAWLYAML